MKSQEVQPGDVYEQDGHHFYTVESVDLDSFHDEVRATVQFADGGRDQRVWNVDQDVPLTRQ